MAVLHARTIGNCCSTSDRGKGGHSSRRSNENKRSRNVEYEDDAARNDSSQNRPVGAERRAAVVHRRPREIQEARVPLNGGDTIIRSRCFAFHDGLFSSSTSPALSKSFLLHPEGFVAKGKEEEDDGLRDTRRASLWPKREGTLNVTRERRVSVCLA